MIRYCSNCKKGTDFPIKSMTDLDNLICPECGSKVDKNSRTPIDKPLVEDAAQAETLISAVFYYLYRIRYFFFLAFSITGIVAYFTGLDKLLYTVTAISVGVYVIGLMLGRIVFLSGIAFIPMGAALGYYLVSSSLDGICLGIMIVFAIRHMFKAFFYKFIHWLSRLGR